MKILIFTYEFPPFTGGAGVYSYDLGSGLASLGVEVHVATCFHSQQGGDENVHGLYQGLNMHFMSKWQFDQNIAHSVLCRLHLKHQFDAVIVSDRYAQELLRRCLHAECRLLQLFTGLKYWIILGEKISS